MGHPALKRRGITVGEFLDLVLEDGVRHELIDGEVVAHAAPSEGHGTIQAALAGFVGSSLKERNRRDGTRCRVVTEAGIPTPLASDHNFRVVDLAVTCEPHRSGKQSLEHPILLIEILSPEHEAKQRAKLHAFAALPSLQEIVFVDSRCIRAEVHRRGSDGLWAPGREVVVGDEVLRLDTCGLAMPLSEAYPFLDLPPGER